MAMKPQASDRQKPVLEALEGRQLLSTYWVSTLGSNNNSGLSQESPLASITHALTRATQPGDTVYVKGGIYRGEAAVFQGSGTVDDRITLAAAPGERPIVRGSIEVTGWARQGESAIHRATWNNYFASWNPAFTSVPQGDTSKMDARNKARNQFFADGSYLEEVPRQMDLKPGSFWIDQPAKQVYVWLADSGDPVGRLIEGANTSAPLLRTNGHDYLTVRGLTFEQSSNAAQANAMARIDASSTGNTSDNVVAENLVVRHAAGAGFGMTGNNNVLRNSDLTDNGQLGLHAGATGSNNLVQGGRWLRNNTLVGKQYGTGWEAGGSKVTRSRNFTIDGVEAAYNRGAGIWFDIDNRNATIRNCRSHHNLNGLHYEVSYTATIYNNLFYENQKQGESGEVGMGIQVVASAGTQIFNNTTFGNDGPGISVLSEGSYQGGTRLPRTIDGLDMSSYAIHVYNNIIADNQRDRYKLSFVLQTDPPVPKEITDNDPATNPVVPWAPNESNNNLFHLAHLSPAYPIGYPYPRKFFNGSPSTQPNPQWSTATDFATKPLADWQARTGWDANSLWNQDPRLLNGYGADFRLAADSPAVSAGLYQAIAPTDHDGEARSASRTDIGAYQMLTLGAAPTVAAAAAATPGTVTGKTASLSVRGADDGGEADLTYTWTTTGTPPAPVTFAANGTNGARDTTATFAKPGTYDLIATIRDATGRRVTSAVSVTVLQTLTSIVVSPSTKSVIAGATQQFTATGADQFGGAMDADVTWALVDGSAGTLSSGGAYTAPTATGPSSATVQARAGAISATASVSVLPVAPVVASRQVNGGTATQRSMVRGLTYTFSTPVTVSASAFTILRRGGDGQALAATVANTDGDGLTWQLTFGGSSLPDGLFDVTLDPAQVRDQYAQTLAAGSEAFAFHRLLGDANGDRRVDMADNRQFTAALGSTAGSPAYRWFFDFNGDNRIDMADNRQFTARLGVTL